MILLIAIFIILLLITICIGFLYLSNKRFADWIKQHKKTFVPVLASLLIITGGGGIIIQDNPPSTPVGLTIRWTSSVAPNVYSRDISPLVFDTNSDGYMDIMYAGSPNGLVSTNVGDIVCISGEDGDILWHFIGSDYGITHSNYCNYYYRALEAGDIDNDGKNEIINAGYFGVVCVNAEDGSLKWYETNQADNRQYIHGYEAHAVIILYVDENGIPENVSDIPRVFIASNEQGTTSNPGELWEVNPLDGTVVGHCDYYFCCHGGLSAGDIDGDGAWELVASDRQGVGTGKGIQAYEIDGANPVIKWSALSNGYTIYCSYLNPLLYNIDNSADGSLEVITGQDNSGDDALWILNGTTGEYIWRDTSLSGWRTHEFYALHDWDLDGDLELVHSNGGQPKSFDITSKTIEDTLDTYTTTKGGYFANVCPQEGETSDPDTIYMEYIRNSWGTDASPTTLYVWDYNGNVVNSTAQLYCSVVQDIDGDGYNELLGTCSTDGRVRCYETAAVAPSPLPRTEVSSFNEQRTRALVYWNLYDVAPATNSAPILSSFNIDATSPSTTWDNDGNDAQLDWVTSDIDGDDLTMYFNYGLGSTPDDPTAESYMGTSTSDDATNFDLNWASSAGWIEYTGTIYIKAVAYDGTDYSSVLSDTITGGIDSTDPSTDIDAITDPSNPTSFTGTATDSLSGVYTVKVLIMDVDDSNYWTGSAWGAETWLDATADDGVFSETSEDWTYSDEISWDAGHDINVSVKVTDYVSHADDLPYVYDTFTTLATTTYYATVRKQGIDYFTWMGANITASNIDPLISGFDEATEYIAIWNSTDGAIWDSTDGLWIKYYGSAPQGYDWTIHTFDVVQTYLIDGDGTISISMTANGDMSYTASRNESLKNLGTASNKGNNYTGYIPIATGVDTLLELIGETDLTTGEVIGVWDQTSYAWKFMIIGFSDTSAFDFVVSTRDVIWTKVSDTRYFQIGN